MLTPSKVAAGERVIAGSAEIGVWTCAQSNTNCCLCDGVIETGKFIYAVGDRWAELACVQKALVWYVGVRDKKRAEAARG
jgi:hypothetical protein